MSIAGLMLLPTSMIMSLLRMLWSPVNKSTSTKLKALPYDECE